MVGISLIARVRAAVLTARMRIRPFCCSRSE
jgi:hypothetical protein